MQRAHKHHKVLLIGSGLMTPALIDYLVKFEDTRITVASNIEEDARRIASKHPTYCKSTYLDIMKVAIHQF